MPRRECIECGTLTTSGPRCHSCTRAKDRARGTTTQRGLGWDHQQVVRQLLNGALVCALCGEPGTPTDPLTGGHITARADGGTNEPGNYQPEHLSCNIRKSNSR